MNEIICAFSGIQPQEEEYVESQDELGEMPIGWSKVTIQTRKMNPEWNMLQAVKIAMAQQLESQIDESVSEQDRNIARISIKMQVDAQFCALEDRTPQFLVDERITYISDPEKSDDIKGAFDNLLKDLDLEEEE